jgi:hypothetical protein
MLFSNSEVNNLNKYLVLVVSFTLIDNYGMDQYIRKEIKKIFPNNDLIEIPANHAIFKTISFTNGLPT